MKSKLSLALVALAVAIATNASAKTSDPKANRALAKAELEKHLALVSGADWTNRCPFKFVFKSAPGESADREPYAAFRRALPSVAK